jgi:3-hydroxyacyl-CoA dehydrogenase
MHFEPGAGDELVEIIRGLATSQETSSRPALAAERLGKNTMTAEIPGLSSTAYCCR